MSEKKENPPAGGKTEDRVELIKPGATLKVHERIKELDAKGKEKERTQIFEGIVIAVKKPRTQSGTFTIRKISENVGVEKVYPINSPLIQKIIAVKQARVRRAKLYYVRSYKKRLKEKKA